MRNTSIVGLVLTALLAVTVEANSQDADSVKRWVENNVPEMMRDAQLPGFAIAVVKDGETIYADAFGARDTEKGLPATTDTLFGIGSITKSFVAISILQLARAGECSALMIRLRSTCRSSSAIPATRSGFVTC